MSERSWKPAGGGAGAGDPRWRQENTPVAAPPGRHWHWGRVLFVLLFFGGLTALLVWVSLWLRPAKDTSLILVGASYQDNLVVPHNVYGWQGLKDLAEHARSLRASRWDAGQLQLFSEPREVRLADDWQRDLRTFPGKTVVLFLSLHGGVDRQGAFLLTQNALLPRDPDSQEKDKIHVSAVLDRLKKVPQDRSIVLVLDATRITECWPLGMLHNDFARALDKLNDAVAALPNLIVVSASDADQRSWVCEDWQRPIFTHYFLEGLRGAADTADDNARDGRINAHELFHYVSRKVKAWTQTNRAAMQTPVLLPRGAEGLRRAKEIHITLAPPYVPSDPGKLAPFVPPAELAEAWNKYAALLGQAPAPSAYAPSLWRLYQERLLRYEQLVRAGAKEGAAAMAGRLKDLEQEITRAATIYLASARNTLAMTAATGQPPPMAAVRAFNQLWDASAKEQAKIWLDMQNTLVQADKTSLEQLRVHMMELLLERAADDPANFDKVYHLLQLVDDPSRPQPSEAHFFVMLRRDLPGASAGDDKLKLPKRSGMPSALLKQAIEVRLRAEKAALGLQDSPVRHKGLPAESRHPYTEHVSAWVRPTIEQADAKRRAGQDLLFATDEENWKRASNLLGEANASYEEAQAQALLVRQALAVRDEAAPQLPFLARWLAARPVPGKSNAGNPMADKLSDVCRQTHALTEALATPQQGEKAFKGLGDQANVVWRLLQEIGADARAYRLGIPEEDTPRVWHDLHDALLTPFTDAKLRMELLARHSRIGLRLLTRQAAGASAVGQALPPDNPPKTDNAPPNDDAPKSDPLPKPPQNDAALPGFSDEPARDRAVRQGKLALALLGQRWFDDCGQNINDKYEVVEARLKLAANADRWWELSTVTGEEIGLRWQLLADEIQRLHVAPQNAAAAGSWSHLLKSDRLLRLADARTSLTLTYNPALVYRQALLEDLLFEQARRAYLEHWQAEDPSKAPYYRTIALSFLKDAQALPQDRFAGKDPRLPELREQVLRPTGLSLALSAAPGFALDGFNPQIEKAPTLHFTSEKLFAVQMRLALPDGAEGFPTLWTETGPGLRFTSESNQPSARLVPDIQGKQQLVLNWTLESPLLRDAAAKPPDIPQPTSSFLIVRGLYRGQAFSNTVAIDLHPLPQVVMAEQPLPLKGSVTVRASKEVQQRFGASNGAVTIVLDCSGSMRPAKGDTFDQSTKFVEATTALEQMLRKVPKGAVVSLWAFGQATGDTKTVEAAEQTIAPVVDPTPWDPEDKALLAKVMARVAYPALEPWNESPIVRAMLTASRDLRTASGFRTLIVLTDGMDNRFDKDPEMVKLKKDIPTVLREAFPDIEVNIVGFKFPNQEEEDKARRQFKVIEELPLPGKFYMVNEAPDLLATLEKSFKQKLRYWVDTEDNRPLAGIGATGLEVGTDASNEQWYPGSLDPGGYKVRVQTNQRIAKAFALNHTDMLLVELAASRAPGAAADSLVLERLVYSLADFPYKPFREKAGWRLAALQTQSVIAQTGDAPEPAPNAAPAAKGLQMLVTLEKKPDETAATLQQPVPVKTWLELTLPPGSSAPFAMRWRYQPGYPAPAWSIDSPAWPGQGPKPAKPHVKAWWNPAEAPVGKTLERGRDFDKPLEIAGRSLVLGKETVVVESVQVEDQLVETAPATPKKPATLAVKPCLVIRARHAFDKPIWAQVKGVKAVGVEHRFYAEAGKYMGVFWPVTRDEAAGALQRIELFSLAAFKEAAEARKCDLLLDNCYEPQASDTRPLPPTDLSRWLPPGPNPLLPTSGAKEK